MSTPKGAEISCIRPQGELARPLRVKRPLLSLTSVHLICVWMAGSPMGTYSKQILFITQTPYSQLGVAQV